MSNGVVDERAELVVAERFDVTFNLAAVTLGDIRRAEKAGKGDAEQARDAVLDMLDKAVVGGLDAIPVIHWREIFAALMQEITEAGSPKDEPAARP